jgi:hypothetical protein
MLAIEFIEANREAQRIRELLLRYLARGLGRDAAVAIEHSDQ